MKTSQNGINLIKKFEGVRLNAYKCTGVWTICYGHTAGVRQGQRITQEKAEELLKNDLIVYENYVNATKLPLAQNQFDALVCFTYNCGKVSLQTLVRNRNIKQIGEALLLYNKGNGKVLEGLVARRKAERELFFKSVTTAVPQNNTTNDAKKLPYDVKTICDLNIRTAAGVSNPIIRVAKKGEILKVWATCTTDGLPWGKNGNEWYCLKYCKIV